MSTSTCSIIIAIIILSLYWGTVQAETSNVPVDFETAQSRIDVTEENKAHRLDAYQRDNGSRADVGDGESGADILSEGLESPDIIVDPLAIESDMFEVEIAEHVINVANDGDEMLRFTIEHEIISEPERDLRNRSIRPTFTPTFNSPPAEQGGRIAGAPRGAGGRTAGALRSVGGISKRGGPHRDDLGDIIDQFNVGEGFFTGLTWDGELMWGVDYENARMVGGNVDMELLEVELPVEEAEVEGFTGMCWDGEAFWFGSVDQEALFRIDREGNLLGGFELPAGQGEGAFSVTWDGECLWYLRGDIRAGGDPIMRRVTVDGELVQSVSIQRIVEGSDSDYWGIVWVPEHEDENMWLLGCEQWTIHQLEIDDDQVEIEQEVELGHGEAMFYGLGHDGSDLWYCDEEGTWFIMDDGITEHWWLGYEPNEGELAQGEDMDVIVTLDATGCIGGDYAAELHFLSNDPENPDVIVEVLMRVVGVPDIDVTWSEEAGYPDVINLNGFGDMFAGGPYAFQISIANVGTDDLVIEDIFTDNDVFGVEAQDILIPPRENMVLDFIIDIDEPGRHEGILTIISNDPDEGELNIPMVAEVFLPPAMVVSPDRIVHFFHMGEVREHVINISNEGDADLRFSIEHEYIAEPGRDDAVRSLRRTDGVEPFRDRRGGPDDMGYEWRDNLEDDGPEFDWIDMNQDWVRIFQLGDDDNTGRLPLGWSFPLWDREYDHVFIDSDGWMSFVYDGDDVMVDAPQYPVEAEGWREATIAVFNRNNREGTDIWFWTNEEDMAVIWWFGDHQFQSQLILDESGFAVMQYGENIDQTTGEVGVNLGDGEHGWFISGQDNQYIVPGRAIAFGPPEAWRIPWLTYEPMEGVLEPDEDVDVIINLDAEGLEIGVYEAELHILSDDPANREVIVPVFMGVSLRIWWGNWDFVETDVSHLLEVTELTFNDEPVPSGWEIVVLTPEGVLSGGVIWIHGYHADLIAYGAAEDADQFEEGEEFTFRVWDYEADVEYNAEPVFLEGPRVYVDDGVSVLSLNAFDERILVVRLFRGWNMISINVIPGEEFWEREEGPDVVLMFDQLRYNNGQDHYVEIIKDERGNFYSPPWGFNGIPYWNLEEGYQVKIDPDIDEDFVELVLRGAPLPADGDIRLDPGWHIIAYLPTYRLNADAPDYYVLSPIIDAVGIAKNCAGQFMIPEFGFSNMPPWRETQGYQVRIDSDEQIVLNYPPEQEELASTPLHRIPREGLKAKEMSSHWKVPVSTGSNMSLLITNCDATLSNPHSACELGVFTPSGQCVGAVVLNETTDRNVCPTGGKMWGMAVWGDDPTTEEIDGALKGEVLNFKLWDGAREHVAELDWLVGDGQYATDGFAVAEASFALHPSTFILNPAYPNPFNSVTRFSYGLPEAGQVSIHVYDAVGRMVTTLVDGEKTAGYHAAVWDASKVPAGVYLVRMEVEGFSFARKVILMK